MTPHIYLFSYNRAQFLQNCLTSIEECAPQCGVTLVDDGSDDPRTVALLRHCRSTHEMLEPENEVNPDASLGGLYNNMNRALRHARDHERDRVIFIQDDMQFVRRLTETDLEYIETFYNRHPRSFKLQTTFLKKEYKSYDEYRMTLDAGAWAYFREREGPGLADFSDVGVFHVPRFFSLFGEIQRDELKNDERAGELNLKMGFYVYPFMMWLPFPISYRHGRRSLIHRLHESLGKGGYYPIDYLSGPELTAFLERDMNDKPYAEDFLQSSRMPGNAIWATMGGRHHVAIMGGWRHSLSNALLRSERYLRQHTRRCARILRRIIS